MSYLSLKNIEKFYDGSHITNNLSLDIEEGEFIVLVGASGCGKSTLLRMIAGLEDVTNGKILLQGKDITSETAGERDMAMVFQNYALYPHKTVYENMAFALEIRKIQKHHILQKVHEVASILKMKDLLDRYPKELSGGQRQRVAIGRALIRDPKVFLFDEPLSNLDAKLRAHMRAELKALHEKLGKTMIYVTHDQVEAMTLADRIVVLNKGNIEQVGTAEEIYNHPQNRFVAEFIGSPQMNIIPIKAENGCCSGKGFQNIKIQSNMKGDKLLGIRPQHFNIVDTNEGIPFNVDITEFLGSETVLTGHVKDTDQKIIVNLHGQHSDKLHKTLYILPNEDYMHFFAH